MVVEGILLGQASPQPARIEDWQVERRCNLVLPVGQREEIGAALRRKPNQRRDADVGQKLGLGRVNATGSNFHLFACSHQIRATP